MMAPMRYLLVVALLTISCGGDYVPTRPTPPPQPPTITIPPLTCYLIENGQKIVVPCPTDPAPAR